MCATRGVPSHAPRGPAVTGESVAVTAGSLRRDGPMFVSPALGAALVLVFLTFLSALSLGPLAEGLR